MKKGQSSIEFLSLISMSMLLLAALFTVSASKQAELSERQVATEVQTVAKEVSFQMEMALVQGEGYSRIFSVPATVAGYNYNVSVGGNTVVLSSEPANFTGSSRYHLETRTLSTEKSNVYRVKNNGSIYLEPVE